MCYCRSRREDTGSSGRWEEPEAISPVKKGPGWQTSPPGARAPAAAGGAGTERVTTIETTGGPRVAERPRPPPSTPTARPRRRKSPARGRGAPPWAPGSLRLTGRARASWPGRGRGAKPLVVQRHRAWPEDPCPRRVRKCHPGAPAPHHRAGGGWPAAAGGGRRTRLPRAARTGWRLEGG